MLAFRQALEQTSQDALSLARQAGSVMAMNMVLLGALMETQLLPLTADHIKEAISTKTKKAFVDINLKAFDLGARAARQVEAEYRPSAAG